LPWGNNQLPEAAFLENLHLGAAARFQGRKAEIRR
jgi:hypothetical protein